MFRECAGCVRRRRPRRGWHRRRLHALRLKATARQEGIYAPRRKPQYHHNPYFTKRCRSRGRTVAPGASAGVRGASGLPQARRLPGRRARMRVLSACPTWEARRRRPRRRRIAPAPARRVICGSAGTRHGAAALGRPAGTTRRAGKAVKSCAAESKVPLRRMRRHVRQTRVRGGARIGSVRSCMTAARRKPDIARREHDFVVAAPHRTAYLLFNKSPARSEASS